MRFCKRHGAIDALQNAVAQIGFAPRLKVDPETSLLAALPLCGRETSRWILLQTAAKRRTQRKSVLVRHDDADALDRTANGSPAHSLPSASPNRCAVCGQAVRANVSDQLQLVAPARKHDGSALNAQRTARALQKLAQQGTVWGEQERCTTAGSARSGSGTHTHLSFANLRHGGLSPHAQHASCALNGHLNVPMVSAAPGSSRSPGQRPLPAACAS
jgi:hypothetical protein